MRGGRREESGGGGKGLDWRDQERGNWEAGGGCEKARAPRLLFGESEAAARDGRFGFGKQTPPVRTRMGWRHGWTGPGCCVATDGGVLADRRGSSLPEG